MIELLKAEYRVQDVIDYSGLEPDGLFLEGTGAMVLDHIARVAYTARSNRANPIALERFATHFNYEPLVFDAVDAQGRAIYHTNVLMCIATQFALVALDAIMTRIAALRSQAQVAGAGNGEATLDTIRGIFSLSTEGRMYVGFMADAMNVSPLRDVFTPHRLGTVAI